ncbi:DUF5054 domain-containing [Chlorella sorokiniana]|uniref:DUF5054 domain-containing n=1 Tax=Chlorella sorokiniana TaxID=3076 RepID=A0A2P6U4Z0_CHLSO|nr:DUF5054 domain-containing [Chlorella sorokiniana]|eukprot:PRW61332.1 DUF5054 domain-containing [Chlorella sorokiniana]
MPESALHTETGPSLTTVWHGNTADGGLHIVTKAHFPDHLVQQVGAPAAVWTEISAPFSHELHVSIFLENKTATQLQEATWIRWMPDPAVVDTSSWLMYKLGRPWLSPDPRQAVHL